MENIQRIIHMELMEEDGLNFNLIGAAVQNLVQPVNIVQPERINPIRNEDYYENAIPNYTLDDFKNHFRMFKGAFQVINLHKTWYKY